MKIKANMVVRLIRYTCYSNNTHIVNQVGKPVVVTHTKYCGSCLKDHAYIRPIDKKNGYTDDLDLDCFIPVNRIPVEILEMKNEEDMRRERAEAEIQQNQR
jgi:hypothetical protein